MLTKLWDNLCDKAWEYLCFVLDRCENLIISFEEETDYAVKASILMSLLGHMFKHTVFLPTLVLLAIIAADVYMFMLYASIWFLIFIAGVVVPVVFAQEKELADVN